MSIHKHIKHKIADDFSGNKKDCMNSVTIPTTQYRTSRTKVVILSRRFVGSMIQVVNLHFVLEHFSELIDFIKRVLLELTLSC